MCPVWPLHIIFFYLLTLVPVWVVCQAAPYLTANFNPDNLTLHMEDVKAINVTLPLSGEADPGNMLQIRPQDDHIAMTNFKDYELTNDDIEKGWNGMVNITGKFLGKTKLKVTVYSKNSNTPNKTNSDFTLTVIREQRVIDTVFTSSVATLVSLIYINFGCALDWSLVKATIKRPIGPVIGFSGQFILLPIISYCLGLILFPGNTEMQLGMFFTGVSPGGGASNIWTYVLGGNLNLSVTMTAISNIAAFGMMPLWLFTLGRQIFKSGNLGVPYSRIAGLAVGLVIPLGIGLLAQRYLPRFAKLMVRILKGFSSLLLIFIIVFAIVTNLYLFELFSWQIVVGGILLPWLGYLLGYIGARVFRQPPEDCLAIALETGIQNTGISIFLLRFSLDQPNADLTTVVPVAVAIMTPIPMILIYIYQLIKKRYDARLHKKKTAEIESAPLPISGTTESIANITYDHRF